jgi:hypothetical protein
MAPKSHIPVTPDGAAPTESLFLLVFFDDCIFFFTFSSVKTRVAVLRARHVLQDEFHVKYPELVEILPRSWLL